MERIQAGQARAALENTAELLEELLGAEVSASEQRRLERRLRLAGFPHRKTLEGSTS